MDKDQQRKSSTEGSGSGGGGLLLGLPCEIKVLILQWLPLSSLILSQILCKELYSLCNDEEFWRRKYEKDCGEWKILTSASNTFKSTFKFKKLYITQFKDNNSNTKINENQTKTSGAKNQTKSTVSGLITKAGSALNYLSGGASSSNSSALKSWESQLQGECRIFIFGEGGSKVKGTAAKRMMYSLMNSTSDPLRPSGKMYKGIGGMGSGIGFIVNTHKEANMITLHFGKYSTTNSATETNVDDATSDKRPEFFDVRGISKHWKDFVVTGRAFVFVLEVNETKSNVGMIGDFVASAMHVIKDEQCKTAPVLIFVTQNKSPESEAAEEEQQLTRISAVEVSKQIKIAQEMEGRNWCIRVIDDVEQFGPVADGFVWLSNYL